MFTQGYVARRYNFRASLLSKTDLDLLLNIYQNQGGSKDCLFVKDPDATTRFDQFIVPGVMRNQFQIRQDGFELFTVQNEIVER